MHSSSLLSMGRKCVPSTEREAEWKWEAIVCRDGHKSASS